MLTVCCHSVLLLPVMAEMSVVVQINPVFWFLLESCFSPIPGHQQWILKTGRKEFLQKALHSLGLQQQVKAFVPKDLFCNKSFVQLSEREKGKNNSNKILSLIAQCRVVCTNI